MLKVIEYTYLGTNGTLTTPIHLEGIYSIKKYRLIADKNKVLTNGKDRVKVITLLEDEVPFWYEIDEGQE